MGASSLRHSDTFPGLYASFEIVFYIPTNLNPFCTRQEANNAL